MPFSRLPSAALPLSVWPDVHVEHLQVHKAGKTFAEITEGNPWPDTCGSACTMTGPSPDR
jgi:hypothetical protein